jgi:hypothetical protein
MSEEKGRRADRRRANRKYKIACPCKRVGCETGRGVGISDSVLKRRDHRRGGTVD